MEFIKNNQCLKIRLKYDYESGQIAFQDFVEANELEHISGCEWLKIGNQSAPHYKPEYLRHDDWIIEELLLLRHVIGSTFMPALTLEEGEELFEQVRDEDWENIDFDTSRRGLLSVSHLDWYAGISYWDDISAELEPYCYMARGHSQGDYARLYLIGMEDAEAETLVRDFEVYAYDTPCYFDIDLIDCATGKVMDSTGLGGIYDTTSDLDYLKAELVSGIKSLSYLDDELKTLALEAVQDIDYTNIDNNF